MGEKQQMKNTSTLLQSRNQQQLQDVLKYLNCGRVLIVFSELTNHCYTVVEGKRYSPDVQRLNFECSNRYWNIESRKYFACLIFIILSNHDVFLTKKISGLTILYAIKCACVLKRGLHFYFLSGYFYSAYS